MMAEQISHAHAHPLAVLMGETGPDFFSSISRKVEPKNVLHLGSIETTSYETDFIAKYGCSRLSSEDVSAGPQPLIDWLKRHGLRHAAIHFDLDALHSALTDFLLFNNPAAPANAFEGVAKGRMTMEGVLHAIATTAEIVGLAITEYVPWSVIKLSDQLRRLPLLGDIRPAAADIDPQLDFNSEYP